MKTLSHVIKVIHSPFLANEKEDAAQAAFVLIFCGVSLGASILTKGLAVLLAHNTLKTHSISITYSIRYKSNNNGNIYTNSGNIQTRMVTFTSSSNYTF